MNSSPSPNQSSHLPIWYLLLLGLGIPITTVLTIGQAITQHFWQAIGIALLYVVIVLVSSFVIKIWQQIENDWVKRTVNWLNTPHDYEKRYRRWFIDQHNQFDIGGLTIYGPALPALDKIFVEMNFVQKPPHLISSGVFKTPKVPSTSQRPLSYFILEGHLVLLGQPGSGKTTVLKNQGVTLLTRKKRRSTPDIPYELPFYLALRDYGNVIKEQEWLPLADAVQSSLRKHGIPAPPEWIEGHLKKGRCLILLDGLDEVSDEETRLEMAQWVQRQMATYGHDNRFILTSRLHGYEKNPINGAKSLEIQEFTHRQIEDFASKWCRTEEENRSKDDYALQESAASRADNFLRRLKGTPALFDLVGNPLLLTMSIMVHNYRGALPGSRGELYKEICEAYLGGRQRAKGLRLDLSPDQNQLVLQPLAFYMMEKQTAELTLAEAQSIIVEPLTTVNAQLKPLEFLNVIERSGIWVKQGLDFYGFAHLSFQEYLAAMHVKETRQVQILVDRIGSSWWRETIVLYCNRADASPIIKACMTGNVLSIPLLELALECEEAALRSGSIADASVRALLDQVLVQGAEDADPEVRQIVAEAQLVKHLKSRNMAPLDEEVYGTTSLINCTEYQLFLDEQHEQEMYYQPDHWEYDHFPSGLGRYPVLGVRPSDALAFCSWLTERDQEHWHYRLPRTSELRVLKEIMNEEGKSIDGICCWINEGKEFAWIKGIPPLSKNRMLREAIERSYALDRHRALTYSPILDSEAERALMKGLSYANDLAKVPSLTDQLVDSIRPSYDEVRSQERSLVEKVASANVEVRRLEERLDGLKKQESSLDHRHSIVQGEVLSLERQLKVIEAQKPVLKSDLSRQPKTNQRAQPSQSYDAAKLITTESELERARKREEDLRDELASVQTRIAAEQTDLEDARKNEQAQKSERDNFRDRTHLFLSECGRLLSRTSIYNRDDGFSSSLARNQVIDLDGVLVSFDESIKDEIFRVSKCASGYVHDLVSVYERHRAIINVNNPNPTESDKTVLMLRRLLYDPSLDTRAETLDKTIWSYLRSLSSGRPVGRRTIAFTLMRFATRYLTRVLVDYLSYWLWKELFSKEGQESGVNRRALDILFDLYMTFAMLEERVEGRLLASEGILIVKERLQSSQEQN
jgi:NACHT domain